MSILVDKETQLIVQGITGREGSFHTAQMITYGTQVVGGVTPGKGGEWIHGKPVFDSVAAAVEATGANATHHLRQRAFRRRRHLRSDRRRHPADRLRHRRHPDAGHAQGLCTICNKTAAAA